MTMLSSNLPAKLRDGARPAWLRWRASDYEVRAIDATAVWIVDLNQGQLSVTNDAEGVCRELHVLFPNHRFFYRDTVGRWDELVHEAERFVRFGPGVAPPPTAPSLSDHAGGRP